MAWSKDGEFVCHVCDTMIGKNLKGERPFLLASQHMREHTPSERGGKLSGTYLAHLKEGNLAEPHHWWRVELRNH